ncbi:MAG: class I SAM-dependent methyltransferase [Nitrosopumilus sp.]|uniref:class I SAM-dependent methyltransferase n=1 Tax=Nitrosopumilus sp. TaxID=2024843 RepID=UPI00247D2AD2|nr:class I SAM-dependent methyltransferase [Nitrosopumilus sp.]MCV0393512.1 class I SAM-dependent methyltransferase [Nitrosopumilus sp.]
MKGKQDIRFNAVSKIGVLKNSSVIDIGCGYGDFLAFLNKKRFNVKYTGIDINERFIDIAKSKHPNSYFDVRDIEKKPLKKKFDWAFAIGTTNQNGSYSYIEKLMKEMLKISKKGIAIDFLSTYVDFKKPSNFHASPEKVFKIAKKFSKRVVLKHDYLPFEFCIFIYKNDKISKNISFLK